MEKFKSGFVSIVGKPNTGKSTLLNSLIGDKIAITSPKPQTTRHKIIGILNSKHSQIIFIDTPGMHKTFHDFGRYMINKVNAALADIEIMLIMIDIKKFKFIPDNYILNFCEQNRDIPQICVLNKTDKTRNEDLLRIIDFCDKNYEFNEIVPISALKKYNLDNLIKVILEYLPEHPPFYDNNKTKDFSDEFYYAELIREKIIYYTKKEIPHCSAVQIKEITPKKNNLIYIRAIITVERSSQKKILIGKRGAMIKKIGQAAREEIEKILRKKIFIDIEVDISKNWRKNKNLLKELGYL